MIIWVFLRFLGNLIGLIVLIWTLPRMFGARWQSPFYLKEPEPHTDACDPTNCDISGREYAIRQRLKAHGTYQHDRIPLVRYVPDDGYGSYKTEWLECWQCHIVPSQSRHPLIGKMCPDCKTGWYVTPEYASILRWLHSAEPRRLLG